MSYSALIQNYINGKYTRPPNWADPCDNCGPFPYLPLPMPCDPCCPAPCGPCGPAPCGPCGPAPCGPMPCGQAFEEECSCNKKKSCSCKNKKKCSCKSKKSCSCKRKNKSKSKCINVAYKNPINPCGGCSFNIAPCYEPAPCVIPSTPCDPCAQPWAQYWPWVIRSWGTCAY